MMNFRSSKGYIIIISAIMGTVLFAFLFVLPITPLVIVAYVFALFGIVMFCLGMLHMLSNKQAYPWFVAFPKTIVRYLVAQLVLSATFVTIEIVADWTLPMRWYILMHIVLLALFAIILIALHGAKDVILKRDAEVKEKVATLRFMEADAQSLMRKFPDHEQALKRVVEALRYSDPMSHSSLAVYEEQIQRTLVEMDDGKDIDDRCEDLLRRIADRNSRAKILK